MRRGEEDEVVIRAGWSTVPSQQSRFIQICKRRAQCHGEGGPAGPLQIFAGVKLLRKWTTSFQWNSQTPSGHLLQEGETLLKQNTTKLLQARSWWQLDWSNHLGKLLCSFHQSETDSSQRNVSGSHQKTSRRVATAAFSGIAPKWKLRKCPPPVLWVQYTRPWQWLPYSSGNNKGGAHTHKAKGKKPGRAHSRISRVNK